jgi:hypothetical protein
MPSLDNSRDPPSHFPSSISSTPLFSSSHLPRGNSSAELKRPLHYTAIKLQPHPAGTTSSQSRATGCVDEGSVSSNPNSATHVADYLIAAFHSATQADVHGSNPSSTLSGSHQALLVHSQCSPLQLLAASSSAAKSLLKSMSFQGLAVTAWSQARLAYVPDAAWTSELLTAAAAAVQNTPQDVSIESLSMLMWSLTRCSSWHSDRLCKHENTLNPRFSIILA